MRKHWLLFTQTVTIALALLFIVHTLKPELLPNAARNGVVTLYENTPLVSDDKSPAMGLSAAAQKAMPTVVNIFTSTIIKTPVNPFMDDPRFKFFFGDQFDTEPQSSSSLGSGVIVSPDGYILTNHHVVEAADQIEVALSDGRKAKAHVIGSDPETDLAVIKIELPGNLPAITFGHPEKAHVGDMVLAIGNPFGVGETVTMGIVSALKRDHLGINTFENFIQTDAAINPGNSGGALVDGERQPDRHQQRDLFAEWRLAGHRLRHFRQHREKDHGTNHPARFRDARLDRRRRAGAHPGTGRILQARRYQRRVDHRSGTQRARRIRLASRPGIF